MERGGKEVEAAITAALKDVARGDSLRKAARMNDAPYAALHKNYMAMDECAGVWQPLPPRPPS